MKTNTIYRQIRRISMINLIIPGILLIILIILYFHIPFGDILSPRQLESAEQADTLFSNDIQYVDISFDKLYYTGYDRINNGKISGYYYYSLDNGKCTFVLVDSNNLKQPDEIITGYSMKATLEKRNQLINQMISSFSKDLKWTRDGLMASSSICFIDETGFNSVLYMVLGGCLFIFLTLFLTYLISNILYIIAPGLCPACSKFKKLTGNISKITAVNNELKNPVCQIGNNIYITENYFLYMSNLSLEIIPLDKINYINIHLLWHEFSRFRNKIYYRFSFHCIYKVRISVPHISQTEYLQLIKYFKESGIKIKNKSESSS